MRGKVLFQINGEMEEKFLFRNKYSKENCSVLFKVNQFSVLMKAYNPKMAAIANFMKTFHVFHKFQIINVLYSSSIY